MVNIHRQFWQPFCGINIALMIYLKHTARAAAELPPTPTLTDCPLGKLGGRHEPDGPHPATAWHWQRPSQSQSYSRSHCQTQPHSQTSIDGCVSAPWVQNEIDIECATTKLWMARGCVVRETGRRASEVGHFRSIAANMISHISINLLIIADVDDRPGCALGAFPLV